MLSRGLRTVFVGNIPFDVGEPRIREICMQAGPIQSLRMMTDATGKPRGFAFCEYADANTASSAIRNLNNTEIDGRFLRVGPAESDNNPGAAATDKVAPRALCGHLRRPCRH